MFTPSNRSSKRFINISCFNNLIRMHAKTPLHTTVPFQMLWKIVLIFFPYRIAQAVTRSVKAETELLGLKKRVRFGD